MRCEEAFERFYGRRPYSLAFCPYRICPLGAHSDHQYGKITGFAIDKGIRFAYGPEPDGAVDLASVNFAGRARFRVDSVPGEKLSDWADYLRGATLALGRARLLRFGVSGVIEGEIPIGGLSSSAAVILAFLSALCDVNGVKLSADELIGVALRAETDYVGVSVGTLDQSCEVLSKKDHLLYLDTKDGGYELIPPNPRTPPYEIAIFFSGVERSLASSKFNMRVDELKSAAYAMKGWAVDDGLEGSLGSPYSDFKNARLRDVPKELYDRYRDRLPAAWKKRAEHFYTEFERVEKGARAWREGDLRGFGRLVFESGASSIYNYETGSDELRTLYEIMLDTNGVYGGRFSGAGFKGCCMAIIDPSRADAIASCVTERYIKAFPSLADKFSVHFCRSSDGVLAR